jgi:hypothetical protein
MQAREINFFSFISKVLTLSAAIVIAPIAVLACIPLLCFLAPVAVIALPFMVAAFFGESKEVVTAQKPLRHLQTQYSH